MGGAVISNPLLDAAHKHISISTVSMNERDNAPGLDYSWVAKQYPRPARHDLGAQINSFLSSPRTERVSAETLWVFHVGFWDIWHLAALPRRLATEVLHSNIRDLFFHIERLYQMAQDRGSVAFSDYYSELGASIPLETKPRADEFPREPFRIFLTRLFDITLMPGFDSARPEPPKPHSRSDQLRNAAFLTKYWDALLEIAVDDWLATPDPEYWSIADTVGIDVIEALVSKRSMAIEKHEQGSDKETEGHDQSGILLPRREVASYGISRYLRELMIDRQLRNADLSDRNGLGARLPEDGFLYIETPCISQFAGNRTIEEGDVVRAEGKVNACEEPDNHLFQTEFTVSQRAIHEIGVRAARRFLDQVEVNSRWRGKVNRDRKSGMGRKGYKAAKIKA
ncbi:hypothetical protein HD806DRAFT_485098 [Xylariaceae sp. AK1471]|nr:hypothetical protein HD806DRAFT_485098 [Xylariaceae sp. AK1471]